MGINTSYHVKSVAGAVASGVQRQADKKDPPGKARYRVGEVVRATILDVPERGVAKVELPSGTAIAGVGSDNLRRYDSLLFSIQSVEPRLVLKVHSVPAKIQGADVPDNDILRILGHKPTLLNAEIVRYLRENSGHVDAATLAEMQQALGKLRGEDPGQAQLREIIMVLARMRSMGIPLESEYYQRMKALLGDRVDIASDLQNLYKHSASMPAPLQGVLSEMKTALQQSFSNFRSFLAKFTIGKPGGESSLYDYLRRFVDLADKQLHQKPVQQAHKLASGMLEQLEGQQLYNIHALARDETMLFNLALPMGESLFPVRVEIYRPPEREAAKGAPATFRLDASLSALGEVRTSGSAVARLLGITIQADSQASVEYIEEHAPELSLALRNAGYTLQHCTVRLMADNGDKPDGAPPQSRPGRSVNIVV